MPPENERLSYKDTECGYFCWKGGALQVLTSTKLYVLVFGLIGFMSFAIGSYQVAIITTIEKRFKIPSKTADSYSSKCELSPMGDEVCTEGEESRQSSIILFIANTLMGVGTCIYYTLGISYMDDNSRKNKMPILLASSMTIRTLGPTFGFMLASYVLSQYIDPRVDPEIKTGDPRWIGAWWMGYVPIGLLTAFHALFMWPFPRHLPRAFNRKSRAGVKIEDSEVSFKDFRSMVGRMLNNKVLSYNTISSILYMFGLMGHWTFMPKYLETQFQQSASLASFISGSVGLICTGLGILCSGFVISRYKPNPRTLALWNVLVESIDVIGHFSYAFLGCPTDNLQGHWGNEGWNLTESCNAFCTCPPTVKYTPLCSHDGKYLFYSPCHAGCPQGSFNSTLKIYQNCSCMPDMPLISGPCPLQCATKFNIFLVLLCLMRFFSASGRAGNTILQFRSVSEGDKAVSIGLTEALLAAFAFAPAPIFYGALLDQACLVWGTLCGEKGNCWLYDGKTVRYYINFTASTFLLLATLADIRVWKHSVNLEIYDKEEKSPQELLPLESKPKLQPNILNN